MPGTTTVEMMYIMNTSCTKNQAEAFAILKALEYVHTKLNKEVDKVTTVHTDSMTTLESLNNMYKHTFLTEEIRRKVQEMGAEGGQRVSGGQKPTWGPLVTYWPTS
jgi:ribonuclease HI